MNPYYVLCGVIRAYCDTADAAGLGKILFEVEKAIMPGRSAYTVPKRSAERALFNVLFVAFAEMKSKCEETGEEGTGGE